MINKEKKPKILKVFLSVIILVNVFSLAEAAIAQNKGATIVTHINEKGETVTAQYGPETIIVQTYTKKGVQQNFTLDMNKVLEVVIQFKDVPLIKKVKSLGMASLAGYSRQLKNSHERIRQDISAIQRQNAKIPRASVRPVTIKRDFYYVFNGVATRVSRRMLQKIKKLSYVKKVYPDKKVQATLTESVPLINADDMWNLDPAITGTGTTIAVIDTGIDYNHPDLGGGFGPAFKVIGGYDFVNNDDDPYDDHSHGTHVAGIAAGNGTLNGVAPGAKLMAFKVLDQNGFGSESDIIAGIERACDPDQNPGTDDAVDVINMSLGGPGYPDDAMSQAVDNAVDAGVICAIAAGNDYDYQTIGSPGCARKAITVGSATKSDVISSFSSKGPSNNIYAIKPDIVAPGSSINSTAPNDAYAVHSGTSMASPHIAGAAALLKQAYPAWTSQRVKSALMGSALDLAEDAFTQGTGRVDVLAASQINSIVVPPSLSLGLDDGSQPGFTKSETIEITNISPGSRTYNLSVVENFPVGIVVSIVPTSFTLNLGETQSVNFTITVDNNIVPNRSHPPYAYEGKILIESGAETIRVPFAFIKSACLHILFDEEPCLVAIHNRDDKIDGYCHPGTELTTMLPDGIYDIITFYNIFDLIVFKEAVRVPGSIVNVNKSEAVHAIETISRNENNRVISISSNSLHRIEEYNHEPTDLGIWISTNQLPQWQVSNVSTSYTWKWTERYKENISKIYQFNGYSKGITGDKTFENTAADLKHLTYHYFVNPGIDDLFVLHYLSFRGPAYWSWSFARWGSNDSPILYKPFIQEAYYMCFPDSDFNFGYNYKQVSTYILLEPGHPYPDEMLLQSPFLAIDENKKANGYLYGDISPRFSLTDTNMPIGTGPPCWIGEINNSSTQIDADPSIQTWGWLFTPQLAAKKPYAGLPYELYQNGSLVSTGDLKEEENISVSPGSYTLKIPYAYYLGDHAGSALVSAAFDTQGSDRNPPYLKYFRIFSDNEVTYNADLEKPSSIEFELLDDQALDNVSLEYKLSADWLPLTLTQNGDIFSAPIPSLTDETYVSLKLIASDIAGNILAYELNPAFGVKLIQTPTPTQTPTSTPAPMFDVNENESIAGLNQSGTLAVFGYQMPKPGKIIITIYNMRGQKAGQVTENNKSKNTHATSRWSMGALARGVYFYQIKMEFEDGTGKTLPIKKILAGRR